MKQLSICIVMLFLFGCASSQVKAFQGADINYLILETQVDNIDEQKSARVIFFLSVKDSANFAGTNFRTVLLEAELQEHITRGRTVAENDTLSFLTGALLDSINVGALFPKIEVINFTSGLTRAQKRDFIDAKFNVLQSKLINRFYSQYDFWRFERIVP